jgi:hypothetical protein
MPGGGFRKRRARLERPSTEFGNKIPAGLYRSRFICSSERCFEPGRNPASIRARTHARTVLEPGMDSGRVGDARCGRGLIQRPLLKTRVSY